MANILLVDAPPTMFDEFESIIAGSNFDWSKKSSQSETRGIRRKDTATYMVTHNGTCVRLAMERRLGNRSMFIGVIPMRHSIWRADVASEQLARQIIELLVANGAHESVQNQFD